MTKTALKLIRSPAKTAVLNLGRITITTIRNNFNSHRIFSFRDKFQTQQSVSMPSCAIIRLNRGLFSGKETRNRSLLAVSRHTTASLSTKCQIKPLICQRFSSQQVSRTHLRPGLNADGGAQNENRGCFREG